MSILRNGSPERPFTQICNSCLRDSNLKPGPFAVLMFCLSLPRDWTVNLEYVARHRGMHIDTVQAAIRALVKLGYCRKRQARAGGRFATFEYDFTDIPNTFSDVSAAADTLPPPDRKNPGPVPAGKSPAREISCAYKEKTNQQIKNNANKHIQPTAEQEAENCGELDFDFGGEAQQADSDGEWVDGLDDAGEARLVAEAREAAAAAKPKPIAPATGVGARLNRLPILREVLAKLQLMGLDVPALVKEFEAETAAKQISNPTGYLMGMARKRVALRDGIPMAAVEAMYSTDTRTKGEAMAALVGAKVERRWKGARHRATAGHGPQPVGAHLIAALENRGLTA